MSETHPLDVVSVFLMEDSVQQAAVFSTCTTTGNHIRSPLSPPSLPQTSRQQTNQKQPQQQQRDSPILQRSSKENCVSSQFLSSTSTGSAVKILRSNHEVRRTLEE